MSLSNFDGLLNILDQLEKEERVVVDSRTLQVELRFLRMIIRWGHKPFPIRSYYGAWVWDVESVVAKAYLDIRHLYETRDDDEPHNRTRMVSLNIGKSKGSIMGSCRAYLEDHHASVVVGTDGGLVVDDLADQLLDPLLKNVGHMISHSGIRLWKQQLCLLQRRLQLFRDYCLALVSKPDVLRQGVLLYEVEMMSVKALFACSLCWWYGEYMHDDSLVSDVLVKIRWYEPKIKFAHSRAQREDQSAVGVDCLALEAVMSLMLLLKPGTGSPIVEAEKELLDELMFLKEFLMYPPLNKYSTHQLTQIASMAQQVISILRPQNDMPNKLNVVDSHLLNCIGIARSENGMSYKLNVVISHLLNCIGIARSEDGMSCKLNDVISDLLNCIHVAKAEIRQSFIPKNSSGNFPRTPKLGYVDFFLQNLQELLGNDSDLVWSSAKEEAKTILSELQMSRSLLKNAAERKIEGLEQVVNGVVNVSYKAEFLIDSITVPDQWPEWYIKIPEQWPKWCHALSLSDVVDEVKLLRAEATRICNISAVILIEKASETGSSPDEEELVQVGALSLQTHSPDEGQEAVGFDDEAEKIRDRLKRGSKHLDIVSIVGMPGLGKTTIAQKLYKSLAITSYFLVRSWCCVSQVYTRRSLLLDILADIVELDERNIRRMSDDDLAELLCKSLKGRRYLIVLDDIWSIDAWRDLTLCFPDQDNGSRILWTSRVHDVTSLLAKPSRDPIYLRMFSNKESWLLLQKKVFGERSCPLELSIVGEKIAQYCRGLPLSVVVVAGILRDIDETVHEWNLIAESIRKHKFEEVKRVMGVLELSYIYLPDHLKPCFLYFAVFPEDREITVQKLVLLWISEGLVMQTGGRNLEDVAEGYLKDLVDRSLVMVAKTKSKGGVKSCRLHDLLLQFCLEKAEEENFLILLQENEMIPASQNTSPKHPLPQRVCIHANPKHMSGWRSYNHPHARTLLFFPTVPDVCSTKDLRLNSKLLRVLDLWQFNSGDKFPLEYLYLTHLRYLAIRGEINGVPPSISHLWKLETFLVKGMKGEVSIPNDIWKLRRLRHLHIRDRANFMGGGDTFASVGIESIATPCLRFGDVSILARLSRLRKLRCIFLESWDFSRCCNRFPVLDFLSKLESLKVFYHGRVQYPCSEFDFPSNLKKLTLSKFRLPWSLISRIGRLPNLEVLKLLFKSFEGDTWDVNDGEFANRKFLKLDTLDIVHWNVSSDPFPCLEQLILQRCKKLEGIPSEIGELPTLQKIVVQFCSRSAAESAQIIHEEQLDMGNGDLQVHIHPPPPSQE